MYHPTMIQVKEHYNDIDDDNPMILTNLSKKDRVSPVDIRKVLSNPNPYSTQRMKEITIGGNIYCHVNTAFIYVYTHSCTHFQ